ncbi:hypothetical protein [Nonlabens sp.]|uniref:hypothetical protein n=1 Tax=Nonlabens sp. TaxID=1888209 RepID=UPI0032649006
MTDEDYLRKLNSIEIYCEILLGVLRFISVKNYSDENEYYEILKKNLKFENIDDHLRLRACIDLIEDSQNAITEFNKKGLIPNPENQGEMYLRLYGVLNAVYLQMQAVIELLELFKMPNKKKINNEFRALKIIEVRNKIGAHTPNYNIEKGSRKTESYRLAQTTITKWGDQLMLFSSLDKIEKFNLKQLINEFSKLVELQLDTISAKVIKSLFPNNSEKKQWMVDRLHFVRNKRIS